MTYESIIPCEVCQDLIPLVNDHVASKESERLVFVHAEHCEVCKEMLEAAKLPQEIKVDDTKTVQAMKKYICKIGLAVLVMGAILGVAMSNSRAQFYNLILMPLLGTMSVFLFKRKFWISLVSIVVVSYFGHIISLLVEEQTFRWEYIFTIPFTMTAIYLTLTVVGVIIGALLKFAFQKEKSQ
jgi:hypothetical protein